MAKNRVKGILVEIGGDTSALEKALSKVNGNISSLSKELKDVNSLLKLDPKNTELVSQKQENLTKSITETSKKLKSLEDVQNQVYQKWQNYIKLQPKINEVTTSIENTKKELEKLKEEQKKAQEQFDKGEITEEQYNQICQKVKECKNNLSELKEEQKELNKTTVPTESYQAYQREIIETKNKLNSLKAEASNWTKAGKSIEEFGNKVTNISNKIDNLGNTLTTRLTLPIVGVATAMVSASKEFETAFTGVEKTVDGTAEQMEELRQGIKNMSKEIPSTTTEISAVAEAAGQLGIKTEDILSFTRVMIDLGNSTNLSAEEAASSLAKFANVTKMSAKDYDKLGSTIVALGNNFATTEADIVEMATYLASTGELAGLSQSQILSLATAMSSVGIEAEAGGSAMSKLLKRIQVAVETGSEDLKDFAKVAGMSTKEFKKAFEEDAVKGLSAFISGLNDTKRNGKSAISILESMDIKEVRLSNTILSLANASGVMNDAVELGSKAWEENTALTNEANKRYQTLDSRLQTTKNKIVDMATNMGNKLTPRVNKLLDGVDGLIDKFDNLSDEEIDNIINIGKFVIAVGPAIKIVGTLGKGIGTVSKGFGTFSQAIGLIGKTSTDAFKKASDGTQSLAKGLTFLTSPLGLITVALAGTTVATSLLLQETTKNNRVIADSSKELENTKNKYDELVETQNNKMNATLSEVDNTKKLSDELKTLVDENGKVKSGYEDRVKFILSELKKSLGIEYDMTGDVIKNYKELSQTIDELMIKKRANAILENEEAKYNEAFDKKTNAYDTMIQKENELAKAKQELADYEEKLNSEEAKRNTSMWSYYRTQIDVSKKAVQQAETNLNTSKQIYDNYLNDIATYENDFSIVQSGNNEKIQEMIRQRSYSYQQGSNDIGETINHNIAQAQYEVEQYQIAREKDLANQDEMNAKKNQAQIDAGNNQILKLAEQLAQMTSTTEEMTPQQVEAWKRLANDSYGIYSQTVSQMAPEMQQKIQDTTGVLVWGTPQMQEKAEELGRKTVDEFDKSADAKEKALNVITGYLTGLSDEEKRELLKQAGIENTDIVIDELNKGNLSEENGKNILEGLWKGLNNGTWQGKILGVASGLAQAVNKAFTGKNGWDEHSPSKKMKKFAEYYVQPISDVMKSRQKDIVSSAREMANAVNSAFNNQMNFPQIHDFGKLQGKLSNKIIDSTKTVYTTPNLTIYTQEFDARKIADEVNKVFGSQY